MTLSQRSLVDGPHFLAYVEQILAATLKKGQIVFLDNVSTHKVDGVEEAIEACGARAVSPCRPTAPTSIPSNNSSQDLQIILTQNEGSHC